MLQRTFRDGGLEVCTCSLQVIGTHPEDKPPQALNPDKPRPTFVLEDGPSVQDVRSFRQKDVVPCMVASLSYGPLAKDS